MFKEGVCVDGRSAYCWQECIMLLAGVCVVDKILLWAGMVLLLTGVCIVGKSLCWCGEECVLLFVRLCVVCRNVYEFQQECV